MYTIKIDYRTGNSFGSKDVTTKLDANWSLEIAKENLKRIKEHYKASTDRVNYVSIASFKEYDVIEKVKTERWFNGKIDYWEYSIKLLETDLSEKCYDCFWIGYFETLYGGTIVNSDHYNSELSFTI